MSKPDIKPISIKQFETKQSKYDQVQKLPVRGVLLGPSGAGKGVLLQNMILDIYRDCFERVYIFSPSIFPKVCLAPLAHSHQRQYLLAPLSTNTVNFTQPTFL